MKTELEDLVIEYGTKITKELHSTHIYKLRDYLIKYILINFSGAISVSDLFEREFTKSNVIYSTIYYVEENEGVTSYGAITDFLEALNSFYQVLLNKKYPLNILHTEKSFSAFKDEIKQLIIKRNFKKLRKPDTQPPISSDIAEIILKSNDELLDNIQGLKIRIMIKLLMLYGLKYEKLTNIKWKNIDFETRILKVMYSRKRTKEFNSELPTFKLELPYTLYKDFENLFYNINNNNLEEYIFTTKTGEKITPTGTVTIFKKAKENVISILELKRSDFSITNTSIIKFAIINMIKCDINRSVIAYLTGNKEEILNSCYNYVNEHSDINFNSYLNQKIRGLKMYDKMQED